MSRLQIRTLGAFEVQLDKKLIGWFPTDRVRAMLLVLAMEPGLIQQRGTIANLLWSDLDDSTAKRNLRVCLVRLKKALGDNVDVLLAASRQEIGLISAESDHNQFQTLIASNNPSDWQTAANLVSGDLAEGFELKNSSLFEEWLARQRQTIREQHVALLHKLLDTASAPAEARLRYAQQLAQLEPYDDAAQRQIMVAYGEMGNPAAAITHYDQYADFLREELDAAPENATTALRDQLKNVQSSRPVTLYNVPSQVTQFIGRDSERDAVVDLLRQPGCRMVTLLGAGGIGKTRLSVEVAQQLTTDIFADGVYFAPLVTANTAFDALAILHRVLALTTQGDDLEEQLFAHLRDKQLLLILDNVEQLAGKLRFLASLLQTAAGVKLLVTSRDVVGISAENRFPLSGISDLHDASSLLWSAIQRITPDFELNATNMAIGAKICEQLHGIPLALELAATWINTLDLDSIREEIEHAYTFLESPMHDTPDRHRSLGAIFDHSWELLTPKRQLMLAKASIFRGGLDMKAARAVLGAGMNDLRRLVEQSLLVRSEHNRYSLHELVRQFAEEKLSSAESDAAQAAHAEHYRDLVVKHERQLVSEDALATSELISADLANINVAWRWGLAHDETARLATSVAGMTHFYRLTGRFSEGDKLYVETIDRLGPQADDSLLAQLHVGCAHFRMWQSRHDGSVDSAEKALAAAKRADNSSLMAESHLALGRALRAKGTLMLAIPSFQQGLVACDGDPAATHDVRAEILGNLALVSSFGVAPAAALELATMARTAAQQSGNKVIEAFVLTISGQVYVRQGRFDDAMLSSNMAITLAQHLGNPLYEAAALVGRARSNSTLGKYAESEADLHRSCEIYRSIGDELGEIFALSGLCQTHYDAGDYDKALHFCELTLPLTETRGIAFHRAYALFWKAQSLRETGHLDEAQTIFEELAQIRVRLNLPPQFDHLMQFGLAAVALKRDSAEMALAHSSSAIDDVLAGHSDTFYTVKNSLMGYDVLTANNDPRATKLLQHGYDHIMSTADAIANPDNRQAYIEESIPNHQLIALIHASGTISVTQPT